MTTTLVKTSGLNAPTIHTLSSGLTIIAEQMPVEAVNLNVWLNVGSANEDDNINGMAHFLEHMVFKGTDNLEIGEFERLIEERGAITNAATSQEYTHYFITSAPKDFAHLAPLQLDVVLNPSLEKEAFEKERQVVLEEIRRSEDNPRRRTFYRAMETCFEKLPYRRPVLGPYEVIERLQPQQMRDFHCQFYQPSNITTAVVGNLPVEELIYIVATEIEKIYRGSNNLNFKNVTNKNQLTLKPEKPFQEIVRQEYLDPSLQQARLVMGWRVPGMIDLADTYALDVLAVILGQGKVSRLFRDLREDRGLVSSVGVSNMTQGIQGIFYISATLPTENLQEVETRIREHIRKIHIDLIDENDLIRIRKQVANRFIFANERPSDRANLYGYYYSQIQDLEPAFNYPSAIQSLTVKDLQMAAQKYLDPDAFGIVIMTPN